MKCTQAKRLFGAFWDDDTTQAEREWFEVHFVSCSSCRREYEEFSRVLELIGSLPRAEALADLPERVLTRARRAALAPDRVPTGGVRWVPVTAASAVLLILATIVSPWVGIRPGPRIASRAPETSAIRQPELVRPPLVAPRASVAPVPGAESHPPPQGSLANEPLAVVPDSLFDHGEDVEFILDPVTLKRGRPTMTRPPAGVQGAQAVITF
jgi:anti-sigma factor RsiW